MQSTAFQWAATSASASRRFRNRRWIPAPFRADGNRRRGVFGVTTNPSGSTGKILVATIAHRRVHFLYGAAIGRFQAPRHRMIKKYMQIHLEQARSMSCLATSQCTNSAPVDRRAVASAARVLMGWVAPLTEKQVVQLHVGMGMNGKLNLSHNFKG